MIVLMRVLGRTRDKSHLIVEPLAEVEPVKPEESKDVLEAYGIFETLNEVGDERNF